MAWPAAIAELGTTLWRECEGGEIFFSYSPMIVSEFFLRVLEILRIWITRSGGESELANFWFKRSVNWPFFKFQGQRTSVW